MHDMDMLKSGVQAMMEANKRVRDVAHSYLIPKPDSDEAKDTRRMAMAYGAGEAMVSLFNIFLGLRNPSENAMYSMLNDLTAALNTNPFWVQHTGSLMPLFIAAVNASNDARELKLENEPRWKDLEAQSRCMWVELFPAIIFLVHGYPAMRLLSTNIKKTFLGLMYD